jgi:hypothetical protein
MRDAELSRDGFEGSSTLRVSERELARIIRDMDTFSLDVEGAKRSFSVKLQEQQGWTREYTLRAIEEYKRFMVLAAVSPTEVTPSQTVDQVWHLHLQYTKSYRDEMCAGVLGKHIDHNPGDGAEGEDAHYSGQYLRTLQLYARVFGEAPPRDIWNFSQFDEASLTRGIALAESRRHVDSARSDTGGDISPVIIWSDYSLPDRPADHATDHLTGQEPGPLSSPHIASPAEASQGGLWSSVLDFFGFGSSESSHDGGASSGSSSFSESSGVSCGGDSSSSDASSCGSTSGDAASCGAASSCGGSSCGGGGCGGGGCGRS